MAKKKNTNGRRAGVRVSSTRPSAGSTAAGNALPRRTQSDRQPVAAHITGARAARVALKAWAERHWRKQIIGVRHVFPRAYVLARPAPRHIVVVRPWVDAEPHLREFDKLHCGAQSISGDCFDDALRAGDWCCCGYVSTATSGLIVAIPLVQ